MSSTQRIFGRRPPKIFPETGTEEVQRRSSGGRIDLGNLPQLSQGGKVRSAERCNGIIYGVDNVILPKFVAEKLIKGGQGGV